VVQNEQRTLAGVSEKRILKRQKPQVTLEARGDCLMDHKQEIKPQPASGPADLPQPPHDSIEPDPMNTVVVPPPDSEPMPSERPDLNWTEHED
jgi:hypothetical protein